MIGVFRACWSTVLTRTNKFVIKSPFIASFSPSWRSQVSYSRIRIANSEFISPRFQSQRYSSKKVGAASSRKKKLDSKKAMKDEKEAFYVVRKGDLVGVYKSLSDCQDQVGTSICDPPVSVYKGQNMPKETEKLLLSRGLKNALYCVRASDITEDLFGTLVSCPIQTASTVETSDAPVTKKRSNEAWPEYGETGESMLTPKDVTTKRFKSDSRGADQAQLICSSCTLEFDGASKGNPGQAGAGAVLRADDGSFICRLREGLGVATNNVAEYRAFILGLKYAIRKGFTSIRVRGDSKLVCMQIQGQWKVKNQNILTLYEEAKKLKDKFLSFQIIHVLRDLNSEADAQANLGVELAEGQIQEVIDN